GGDAPRAVQHTVHVDRADHGRALAFLADSAGGARLGELRVEAAADPRLDDREVFDHFRDRPAIRTRLLLALLSGDALDGVTQTLMLRVEMAKQLSRAGTHRSDSGRSFSEVAPNLCRGRAVAASCTRPSPLYPRRSARVPP